MMTLISVQTRRLIAKPENALNGGGDGEAAAQSVDTHGHRRQWYMASANDVNDPMVLNAESGIR